MLLHQGCYRSFLVKMWYLGPLPRFWLWLSKYFKIQIDSFIFPSGSAPNMQEYHCDSSTKLHLFSIVTSSGRAKGVGWTKYGLWFGWRKEIAAKEVQIYLRLPLCLSKSMVIGLAKKRPLALDPFNSILMICQDYTIVSGTSKYPTLPWSKWKLDFRNRPRVHQSFDQNGMDIFFEINIIWGCLFYLD